jgi:hypothetical protein
MCRYASKVYTSCFACFDCRKAFKKPPIEEFLAQHDRLFAYEQLHKSTAQQVPAAEARFGTSLKGLEAEYRTLISSCPQCGNEMANVGMDFKTPKQSDMNTWKNLRIMYREGQQFEMCGCYGIGFVPQSNREYEAYLLARLNAYEQALEKLDRKSSSELSPEQRCEAQEYWACRIDMIQCVLQT